MDTSQQNFQDCEIYRFREYIAKPIFQVNPESSRRFTIVEKVFQIIYFTTFLEIQQSSTKKVCVYS